MKTKAFLSAGRMILLVLATFFTLGFTACSSDDDETNTNSLVGTWSREYNNGKEIVNETYQFNDGETGFYSNSTGIWASFTYQITQPGVLSIKLVYQKGTNIWRESYGWHYSVEGNVLNLNGNKYTR